MRAATRAQIRQIMREEIALALFNHDTATGERRNVPFNSGSSVKDAVARIHEEVSNGGFVGQLGDGSDNRSTQVSEKHHATSVVPHNANDVGRVQAVEVASRVSEATVEDGRSDEQVVSDGHGSPSNISGSTVVVGPHDPIFLNAPDLGNWIECGCGWISNGYVLPSYAVSAHQRHVAASQTTAQPPERPTG